VAAVLPRKHVLTGDLLTPAPADARADRCNYQCPGRLAGALVPKLGVTASGEIVRYAYSSGSWSRVRSS
jgi:hypothetical protein